jgi:hypothetical protein
MFALWMVVAFSTLVFAFIAPEDYRVVLTPALISLNLCLFFVAVLAWRDGELPVFESGTLWVASTTMYSVFPMVNFALGGLRWELPADYRLVNYAPTPQEMGAFTWNHTLYLATFVVVYLLIRGRRHAPSGIMPLPRTLRLSVVLTFVVMFSLVTLIRFIVLPPEAALSPYEGGNFAYRANVPHVFLQVINIGTNVLPVIKLFFAILLLSRWKERKWRLLLFVWLAFEVAMTFRGMSRGPLVILLLSVGILYHRIVRAFSLKTAFMLGGLLVAGFLSFGFLRDLGESDVRKAMIVNNEFQALFANAYDVHMRKVTGILPEPPPQMFWSDLYMLVPSQFLPFEKWDPVEWYAGVLEIRHTGHRTMWGVIAQSMLGAGALEVFLRAVAVAVVLALVHRWYVARSRGFWVTALYAYVSVWTFYTFRSTSFTPLYFVIYYFGTSAALVLMVKLAVAGDGRRTAER